MHSLFELVQLNKIFPDGKTFADCTPKIAEDVIIKAYEKAKTEQDFDLKKFVLEHYTVPIPHSNHFKSDTANSAKENIEALWPALTRKPSADEGSLIGLPFPYVVPGGRFGEIYYWDSYFTMLGLKVSGQVDMIENMVKNFAYLIDTIGYIPNGNRTYFIGRSQPPFFSLMIKLLSEIKSEAIIKTYLPQLQKEYDFWMKGKSFINENSNASFHVVKVGDVFLNRYWDENDTPRPESYREDVELAEYVSDKKQLYRDLRAGAESGWDFSSRWFANENDFSTIHTTDIVPVDLNCLLYHLEIMLAKAYELLNEKNNQELYASLANQRKDAIENLCWNDEAGFYFDYDFKKQSHTSSYSLSAVFPLYFFETDKAKRVATILQQNFLQAGGLLTTQVTSGQQWDAPNGWAPLQWMSVMALEKNGEHTLAKEIASRWVQLNKDVFHRTGKFMEKYNVQDLHLEAGGGEYEGQDGFGWTNGVFLALSDYYKL